MENPSPFSSYLTHYLHASFSLLGFTFCQTHSVSFFIGILIWPLCFNPIHPPWEITWLYNPTTCFWLPNLLSFLSLGLISKCLPGSSNQTSPKFLELNMSKIKFVACHESCSSSSPRKWHHHPSKTLGVYFDFFLLSPINNDHDVFLLNVLLDPLLFLSQSLNPKLPPMLTWVTMPTASSLCDLFTTAGMIFSLFSFF